MVGLSIVSMVYSINDDLKDTGKYDVQMLETLVNKYPTKHEHGFIDPEIKELLDLFENLNMDKWDNAMRGNTCMMDAKDGFIIYHCDILTGLRCALENRDQYLHKWD